MHSSVGLKDDKSPVSSVSKRQNMTTEHDDEEDMAKSSSRLIQNNNPYKSMDSINTNSSTSRFLPNDKKKGGIIPRSGQNTLSSGNRFNKKSSDRIY